ncbi:hypothetical protein I4U23_027940 [Adineta vaga]|nr:hypothetical protein I4U23_027940 [Adineta vaga]
MTTGILTFLLTIISFTIQQIRTDCQNETVTESKFVYRRVCYFANWAAKRYDNISRLAPEDIDPFLCTHINFAFAKVLESLVLAPYEEDDLKGWTANSKGMYERILKLKETNPDLRVLLSVGGWTHASRGFNEVSKTAANIKTFVKNSVKFLRDNKFDGLDLDWEYPGAKDQGAEPHSKTGYTKLVKKLSRVFAREAERTGQEKLLLTCATAAARHRIEAGYEVEEVCKYFDFISVMTYDYHGSWDGKTGHNSPLYAMRNERKKFREWNINSSMHVWEELGCPKEKLNIGLSAYGRAFSLFGETGMSNGKPKSKKKSSIGVKASAAEAGKYTREAGVLAYYEICELLQNNPNNRVFWHRQMSVPYVSSKTLWIGFDNVRSVTLKMQFLKEQGYGGVIIWSLDLDDKTGEVCHEGPFPIFNAAKRELLILPEHLASKTSTCSDENVTIAIEHLHSRMTRIKQNHLIDLRDRVGLALSANRYHDVISIYKNYLETFDDIPPMDRQMLYIAYSKLILDYNFKSYWKLTSIELKEKIEFDYLELIEKEIDYFCNDIVELIDDYFLASKLNQDLDTIITLRQRADFLYFNSSIARPATKQILLQSALRSYTEGVERSCLTLPINEPERVLIQLRKCACEVQLSNGKCTSETYFELVHAIEEMKSSNLSTDNSLIVQMESYRLELEKLRCK